MKDIREKLGKIHLYAGDGKGKTTAAVGLAVRASGNGLKVLFVQFLKSGDSAELAQMEKLGISVVSGQPSSKFVFQMNSAEKGESRDFFEHRLEEIFRQVKAGYDLLVLDEVLGAVSTGMVSEKRLIDLLQSKPPQLEVVITGRDPSDDLIAHCDYYSEIKMRKHPYVSEGLSARAGIEY
ncbi:MAG: cob(I)yrinic acid a,c-diamide adenosyltransferase [Eubacteriales bacterium]|nr:cob(I)yrinic acid a,c-diamide adenosyltransferase [Eubacteriales bacterium]MDD4323885.1 cob(I)yrinic acid a,c-diamide adenosyltransferase [Eubacteriales bacterium]MDD4540767.1 cob(I)yrinic acid a,c-diamide adenosyltransferase [Eubacteriales bacterium]